MKLNGLTRYLSLCFPIMTWAMHGPSTHTWGSCYGSSFSISLQRGPQVCLISESLLPYCSIQLSLNKSTSKVTNTRNPSDYSCDSEIIPAGFYNKDIQPNILQHSLQRIATSEPTRFQCSKTSDPLPLPGDNPMVHAKGDCVGRDRRS